MGQTVKGVAFTLGLTLLIMAGAVEGAKHFSVPQLALPSGLAAPQAKTRPDGQQDACVVSLSHPLQRPVMC